MPEIQLLDQATINQIAAGEVIDRPSSVVKELLENAIDAKATAITVEIKDGGISFIRITDNGCGIEKDQVRKAFLRHATSKLHTIDDLLDIGSLGFRGEALSSIAAIAQVELISKPPEAMLGISYQIEDGEEKDRCTRRHNNSRAQFILPCACQEEVFKDSSYRRKLYQSADGKHGYASSGYIYALYKWRTE